MSGFLASAIRGKPIIGATYLALGKNTIRLIAANDSASGVKKYEELLSLVGKRNLNDPDLAKAVADARGAAEPAKRKIDEEQKLAEKRRKDAETVANLHAFKTQAKAFVEAGDFSGIEKYKLGLDLIKNTQSDNADLAASVGRISHAMTLASAKLRAKRQAGRGSRTRAGR